MATLLIWIVLAIALCLWILSTARITSKWPKVFIVSALSNICILGLYYTPGLYGITYYFINIVKVIPLILLLIWIARADPDQNWSYRAMCLILILQIVTSGWHILTNLSFKFYDELSLFATLLEMLILIIGGLNVNFRWLVGDSRDSDSASRSSTWARSSIERRE